jgi:hypothetical protein
MSGRKRQANIGNARRSGCLIVRLHSLPIISVSVPSRLPKCMLLMQLLPELRADKQKKMETKGYGSEVVHVLCPTLDGTGYQRDLGLNGAVEPCDTLGRIRPRRYRRIPLTEQAPSHDRTAKSYAPVSQTATDCRGISISLSSERCSPTTS